MTGPDARKALAATARAAKYVDGPNAVGYFTAGIDMPCLDIFNELDWHLNAIEFHSKDRDEAIARRDATLAALRSLHPVTAGREATKAMIKAGGRAINPEPNSHSMNDGVYEAAAKRCWDAMVLSHEAPVQKPVAEPSFDNVEDLLAYLNDEMVFVCPKCGTRGTTDGKRSTVHSPGHRPSLTCHAGADD